MAKRKVMIVDDEEDFLRITKINLESTGNYEVLAISNGKEAIEKVPDFKPDVILLDILMPKMDGTEICSILNEDPIGRNIPIITLSALDSDKDKLTMFKRGVVDYLTKPIEKEQLIEKIEKALRYK